MRNVHGLPEPLVKAMSSDGHKPVLGRVGVTTLIDSPLRRILNIKHFDEIEEDVSDRLWSLLGQSAHEVLAKHSGSTPTEKIEIDMYGMTVVGILDYYENGGVIDWKVTSIFSFLLGDKVEWENQLNVYAEIYRQKSRPVRAITIYAILRDWKKQEYKNAILRGDKDYPPIPFLERKIRLWEPSEAESYIKGRVEAHLAGEANISSVEAIPVCSPEERWQRPETWAVMKKGSKRATRVLDTQEKIRQYCVEKNLAEKDYEVTKRPGIDAKCLDYCSVNRFCPYWKEKYQEKDLILTSSSDSK